MSRVGEATVSASALLRSYLDVVTLAEPLQGQVWAASQLTLTQLRALRRLAREPHSLGRLGAELGLAPPSMTRVVDRLEERGLIERRRDEVDRRRVVAAILPAGRRLAAAVPTLSSGPLRRAAESLTPEQRERLAAAFSEFVERVRAVEEPAG